MMNKLSKKILDWLGWDIVQQVNLPDKCVICVAPHTSNFDLPLGLLVYTSMRRKAHFLMKKEWFFFPLGIFFKALGGIPVNRSKKTSLTDQLSQIFSEKDKFQLAITPEGTRKMNNEWKKGFYYIALAAQVPIVVAALDYKRKEARFVKIIMPSGDADKDIEIIKNCYVGVTGYHSKQFSL